eukprot:408127-Karenia_brevis.AAC.1
MALLRTWRKEEEESKCRMGFPEKVSPRSAPHVLCHGSAKPYDLPIRGRRSMLGAVVPERGRKNWGVNWTSPLGIGIVHWFNNVPRTTPITKKVFVLRTTRTVI